MTATLIRRLASRSAFAACALTLTSIAAPALGGPAAASGTVVGAVEREVTFTVDGTVTYGTLTVPAHRRGQRLAAALLLPGSGSLDRNGDQPPAFIPHTLAQLASALAGDRLITLRFDKYTTGRTGLGAFQDHPERLDYPAYVRQAAAAYRLLVQQPETDPHGVRVVGHSEGALTALLIATTVYPRPAGVALLQPQAIRFLDLIAMQLHGQLAAAVAAGQLTPEEERVIGAAVDAAVADLRAHRPVDTTAMPASIAAFFDILQGPRRRFVETNDAVYPPDVARRLRAGTPVLLTCGTNDIQVPCDITTPLTRAVRRAGATGPGRIVLAGVDHLFHDATHPDSLAPALLSALHRIATARPRR